MEIVRLLSICLEKVYPIEELLNPKGVAAAHIKQDMKAGYYDVQQANGDLLNEDYLSLPQTEQRKVDVANRRNRIGLLRRFLSVFRLRR